MNEMEKRCKPVREDMVKNEVFFPSHSFHYDTCEVSFVSYCCFYPLLYWLRITFQATE